MLGVKEIACFVKGLEQAQESSRSSYQVRSKTKQKAFWDHCRASSNAAHLDMGNQSHPLVFANHNE